MFEKILIANRGDQPSSDGAAAKPHCPALVERKGDFTAKATHV
jgi:hypothetical protein